MPCRRKLVSGDLGVIEHKTQMKNIILLLTLSATLFACKKTEQVVVVDKPKPFSEAHRPQLHFSPPQMWMNDPNGMVYHKTLGGRS
jgi:fructan beta-fructosidase